MFDEIMGTVTDTIDEMENYSAYPGAPKREKQKAAAAKTVWFTSAVAGAVAAVYVGYEIVKAAYKIAHPIKSIFKPF